MRNYSRQQYRRALKQRLATDVDLDDVNKTGMPVEEGSEEEERQVKGLYDNIWSIAKGVDHAVVSKAMGVFMITLFHVSGQWKKIIPGFMNQMDNGANLALNFHGAKEIANANKESSDPPKAEGIDSSVEVEERSEVLLPSGVEQRESSVEQQSGVQSEERSDQDPPERK